MRMTDLVDRESSFKFVIGFVLAVVFLGEVLTSYHVWGGALVVIGAFFATRSATTSG